MFLKSSLAFPWFVLITLGHCALTHNAESGDLSCSKPLPWDFIWCILCEYVLPHKAMFTWTRGPKSWNGSMSDCKGHCQIRGDLWG
ncbi:hypothetical protein H2248_012626 [Termitomyces sp. 'cryptogamus']|nr:hypothetical protein H2248_012626 [Termitomyces sp. 'cryptogamus']